MYKQVFLHYKHYNLTDNKFKTMIIMTKNTHNAVMSYHLIPSCNTLRVSDSSKIQIGCMGYSPLQEVNSMQEKSMNSKEQKY